MTTEHDTATDIERLRQLLQGDEADLRDAIELLDLHPADQADIYEALDEEDREKMLALLSAEGVAALLEHIDEELISDLVAGMPRATLARVLDQTDNNVAADILRALPPAEAARTLSQMNTASAVVPLMRHADETAGGIMTRGYVTLHRDMTVEEALAFLRATKLSAEEAYYLYVLDSRSRLQGVVSLRQLVTADSETRLEDIMETDIISVREDQDQEEVANLMQHYRFRAVPVVDVEGVLTGVISADDIIDVIQEEATEDMYIMAGLPGQDSLYAPVGVSARRRIPWLIVNLLTASVAGGIVAAFEGTIADAAALAVFMPIVAGQGGNAGIQTVTIVVRGIALGELEPGDGWRVMRKELILGVIRGVFFGVLIGAAAYLWQGQWAWGAVVGGAMLANMVIAGLMGTLIPVTLRQLKLDPALGSGVFLTAFTDMLGFLFLLGFGTIALSELT